MISCKRKKYRSPIRQGRRPGGRSLRTRESRWMLVQWCRQNHDFLYHRGADASRCSSVCLENTHHGSARCICGAKNGISYLPQEASVFRKLTVEANIMAIWNVAVVEQGASRRDSRRCWMSSAFRTSESCGHPVGRGAPSGGDREIACDITHSSCWMSRSPVSTPLLSLKYKNHCASEAKTLV